MQLLKHADTQKVKRSNVERAMRCIYIYRIKFRMFEVRGNEIPLRNCAP